MTDQPTCTDDEESVRARLERLRLNSLIIEPERLTGSNNLDASDTLSNVAAVLAFVRETCAREDIWPDEAERGLSEVLGLCQDALTFEAKRLTQPPAPREKVPDWARWAPPVEEVSR